jgi:hypothetical protein
MDKRKKKAEDKNDEDEDGVLRPPVVACRGMRGPLHAWQSTGYHGANVTLPAQSPEL